MSNLPPLPTHAGRLPTEGYRFGRIIFTADQMRVYAEEAVRLERERAITYGGDERRHVICLCPDCVKPRAKLPLHHSRISDFVKSEFTGMYREAFVQGVRFAEKEHGISGQLDEPTDGWHDPNLPEHGPMPFSFAGLSEHAKEAAREYAESYARKALGLEREACAKICEAQADRFMQGSPMEGNKPYAATECAAAIRSRSQEGQG
jgi:hypothetical protein